jgi:phage terminase large subunit
MAKPKPNKHEALIRDFTITATRYGCPPDQIFNFLKAGVFLQPKQLQFCAYARECDKEGGPTAIMCGGGRGSGKSNGIIAQIMLDDCQRFAGLKVLVLRKIGKANQEQIQDYRTKLLAAIPHDYKQQAQEIHFPNGSKVLLGNFKDEKDIDRYMGQEYDVIYLMESNQLTFAKKKFIFTCLRTSKAGWRPRAYEDTNPGGIGMQENKQMYVVPWRQGREKETGTRYIHSTVYDNAFINKEYVTQLETLTGWQRKAWLDGDWDFAAGSFFTNFIADRHVIDDNSELFDFKNIRSVWLSYDYGFAHNAAAILHARDKNGIYCALDEWCESEAVIPQQAEGIKEMLENHHYHVSDMDFMVAGRDCFSRNEDGKTIADAFDFEGISFTPAEVDRPNGWKLCHALFGDLSNNVLPKGYIHKRCPNLIAQIGLAQHSEKKSGDIQKFNANSEGIGGDDALDAWRFGIASDPNHCVNFAKPVSLSRNPYQLLGFG